MAYSQLRSFFTKKISLWTLGIVGLFICVCSGFYFSNSDNFEKPIVKQLEALKSDQIAEAYFRYTSEAFQHTHAFPKFKEFVKTYPILSDYQRMFFGERHRHKNEAELTLYLSNLDEAEIHYRLVKEERNWKIESIDLIDYRKEKESDSINTTAAMLAPIDSQLKALRSKQLIEAYKGVVSKQFMKQTPFEDFRAFVIAHPLLTNHDHFDFKEHAIIEERGVATVVLNPEEDMIALEYRLINEEGQWKIQMMRLDSSISQKEETKKASPEAIISVVRDQLELLKQKEYRKVYDLIAKQTRDEISYENFHKFIEKYPSLFLHTAVNIREPSLEKDTGRVIVELIGDEGTTLVEYNLISEGGNWKILGMHIASTPEEEALPSSSPAPDPSPTSFKARDLVRVIEAFLATVQAHEMTKAYDFTSKEFQYANSQSDFNKFFVNHPEFGQSIGSNFEKELFNNAIATFIGRLFLKENREMPVEFDLIYQEDAWKILHIYALPAGSTNETKPPQQTSADSALEFIELQLGNAIDDQGQLVNPITIFKSTTGDIYALLKMRHATPGTDINVVLRHVNSDSELAPIRATLTNTGDETATFLFSPPPTGWPKGSYQLRISSSSNAYKTFTFSVE